MKSIFRKTALLLALMFVVTVTTGCSDSPPKDVIVDGAMKCIGTVKKIEYFKVTNKYTRVIKDETVWVIEFDAKIEFNPGLSAKYEDFSASFKVVKRGDKWYYYGSGPTTRSVKS